MTALVDRAPASIFLVPTEAHVDRALRSPRGPGRALVPHVRSMRAHQRDALAWLAPGWSVASRVALQLAARVAVRENGSFWGFSEDSSAEVPAAAWQAIAVLADREVGALRRTARPSPSAPWAESLRDAIDARLLAARAVDPRGIGAWLARALDRAPIDRVAAIGAAGAITLLGVIPWDADDLAWIEALHRASVRAGGEGVTLVLDAVGGAPEPLREAVERIPSLLEARWGALDEAPSIAWNDEPQALNRRAVSVDAVVSARTAEAEARAAVAWARAAILAGNAPEAVAIVVPDLRPDRLAPIASALRDVGLPHALAAGRPVASCPDGRAILALAMLAEGRFTRELLLDVLRAPGVHPGRWVGAGDEREATERALRLCHRLREIPLEADDGGALFVELLSASDDDTELGAEDGTASADAWMASAIERLRDAARSIAEAKTWGEVCRRFSAILMSVRIGAPSARDLADALFAEDRGARPLGVSALGEGTAAGRALAEAVSAAGREAEALGLAAAPVDPAVFRAWLDAIAAELRVGATGPVARAAAIRVATPEALAGLDVTAIAITGLDEHAYGSDPESTEIEANSDVTEDETTAADSAGPGAVRRAPALASLLAHATSVALSRVVEDDDPAAASRHPLITWALDRGAVERREPSSRLHRAASRTGPRSAELGAIAAGAPPAPELAERVRIERDRLAFFMDPRMEAAPYTGRVALVGSVPERLLRLVGGARPAAPIAVTAVERAAGCAFAGFARRVLRLHRGGDVSESGDARERGTLVHRALHAAFVASAEVASEAAPDLWRAIEVGRAAAERALGLARVTSPLRREALSNAVRDALAVLTRAWLDASGLRFRWGEQPFGPKGSPPWRELRIAPPADADADNDADGAPADPMFVEGTIDRIDASHDLRMLRVIDYKTGRLPEGEEARIALQLPLYAEAARRAITEQIGEPPSGVHALYVRIAPRGVVEELPKAEKDRAAIADRFPDAAAVAHRAVSDLWRGRVAPRPMFLSLCAKCEARDVCRRPAVMPIEEVEERSG